MARSIGAVEPAGRDIGAVQSAYTPLLYRGLVSRWSLDEASSTRFDSYGENDLTPTGSPGNTTGVSGSALLLTSDSQALSCPVGNLQSAANQDLTVSAWCLLNSKPVEGVVLSNDYPGYILRYNSSTDRLEWFFGTTNKVMADVLGSPATGVVYHLVGRYRASGSWIDFWVNGVYQGGTNITGAGAGGTIFYIGTRFGAGSNNGWADGWIDEVAVWNRYLSNADIETLYGLPSPLAAANAYWRLEEAAGADRVDSVGGLLLDELGGGTVGSGTGAVGQAAEFDTVNYLHVASNATLQAGDIDLTVAAWVRLDVDTDYRNAIYKWSGEYVLYFDPYWPGGKRFVWGVSSTGADFTGVGADTLGAPTVGVWYHLAGVHDAVNNLLKIYVNGVLDTQISYSLGINVGTAALLIGPSWDGGIDEVLIAKRAFSADDVAALYNGGSGLAYAGTPPGWPYADSLGAPDTVGGLRVWTMADGDLYQDSTLGTPATADTDPVGAWEDQTAFGEHLTQTTSGSRPLLKLAQLNGLPVVRFDGSNDYLSRVLSATIAQPGTVYLVGTVTVAGNYFMDGDSGGRWALADALGSAGSMGMYAGSVVEGVSSLPSTAVWTAVFNGASSELYKDGVLLASGDAGSQDLVKLFLGSRYSGTDPLNGDIAEVAVYDRVHGATRRATVIDGLTAKWIASGPAPFTATGTLTLGSVTISGSATFSAGTKTATGTLTLGHPTISGSATFTGTSFTGSGALAATKATVSGSASFSPGTKTATGTLTTGHPVLSGSATFSPGTHTGTGTLTLNHPTVSGSATFSAGTKTATGALTLGHPTLSGSATFTAPVYTATGTLTTSSATVSGTAAFATVVRQATGALSVTRVAVAGSATFVPKYTATGALVLGHPVLSGSATFAPPVYMATGTLTLGHVVVSGMATFIPKKTAAGDLVLGHPVISGVVGFEPSVGVGTGALVVGNAFIGGTATFVPDSGFDPPGDRGEFFAKPVQYARRISVKPNVYATRTFWSDPTMPAPTETLYMTDKESKTLGVSFAREGSVLDGEELTNPQVFIDPEPESNVLGEPEVIATGFKDSDGKIIKAGKGVKVRVQNVPAGTYTLTCRVATNSDPALEWACKLIVDESKGI